MSPTLLLFMDDFVLTFRKIRGYKIQPLDAGDFVLLIGLQNMF